MPRRRWIALAATTVLVVGFGLVAYPRLFPGDAQLAEWMCTDTMNSGQSFCRTVGSPDARTSLAREVDAAKIALLAKVNGVVLEPVPMTWGDLWVEQGVPADIRRLLATSLDGDLAQVTAALGRQFGRRPKIVAFQSAASFESGLRTLFALDDATARTLARTAGGALLAEVRTIAINWGLLSRETPLTILRHELAHAIVRDIAGDRALVPAWFDEGLATRQQNTARPNDLRLEDDRYAAAALLRSGRGALGRLSATGDWIRETVALEGRTYALAEAALEVLAERVGTTGLATLVGRIPAAGFEVAFREIAGMAVGDFERAFPALFLARAPQPAVSSAAVAGGGVEWRVRGLAPDTPARVTIAGPDAYRVEFDIRTDRDGHYRARFGSNVAPGTYELRVTDGATVVRGELAVRR